MSHTPRILVFACSLRRDSLNKKLARVAADAARAASADVTFLDLRELPLPIYDGDLEAAEGLPENAKRIKKLMKEHQGFLIACPEYNSSITPLFKNTIDWASRAEPNEPALACFKGKVAGIMSASPGNLGGLRGLLTTRAILAHMQVLVVPEQIAISKANEAFSAEGKLVDAKHQAGLEAVANRVVHVARALSDAR
jgi:NAD(P)H-dependent FMN reductase